MSNPSNNWLANLKLLIQEAHAETDMSLMAYLEKLYVQNNMYGDTRYDDYRLAQAVKKQLEQNFTINVDIAKGSDYTVISPASLVDDEKSLNES